MKQKVLVAMSGGVDSSVAAYLLKAQGYDVAGATMDMGFGDGGERARSCGPDAVGDARRVCEHLKIPHHVFDFTQELEKKVIAKFISQYAKGKTPNPCVDCNRDLKFGSLFEKAMNLGFDYLATGHYAAIESGPDGFHLKIPKDRIKDQTYFLYAIDYERLGSVLFPLASLAKEEVKGLSADAGLPVARNQESQDICFVAGKGHQRFLAERIREIEPGPIEDTGGNVLGTHRGIVFYTIGQRGGLGISYKAPLYVVSIDARRNRIIVGEKENLRASGLIASNLRLLSTSWPEQAEVKIRYRNKKVPCRVNIKKDRAKVAFIEEQKAVAPGQSAVFYSDDRVLGGGEIEQVLYGHC